LPALASIVVGNTTRNMRKLLAIVGTLLSLTTMGQNADTAIPKKLAIGLTFSPDYSYRSLKPDNSGESMAEWRDSFEIPKFGYTTGLSLVYRLNKRISMEAGIQFSDKGEQTKQRALIYFQPEPKAPDKIKYTYSYLYIDVPIKAYFRLTDKRLKLFLSVGLSPNIFIAQKITSYLTYEGGSTQKSTSSSFSGLSRINLAVLGGLGLDYELTDRINLRLEPIYRRSITSIIDAPIKAYLYSIGVNMGVYYRL